MADVGKWKIIFFPIECTCFVGCTEGNLLKLKYKSYQYNFRAEQRVYSNLIGRAVPYMTLYKPLQAVYMGHLAAPTRSHLIGDHPSGLTKEQRTETMNPSP